MDKPFQPPLFIPVPPTLYELIPIEKEDRELIERYADYSLENFEQYRNKDEAWGDLERIMQLLQPFMDDPRVGEMAGGAMSRCMESFREYCRSRYGYNHES